MRALLVSRKSVISAWAGRHAAVVALVVVALLVMLPAILRTGLLMRVASTILIYCLLSMSLMLITGITGMMDMGHVAFYGIGAYVSALLALKLNLPFAACFLAAALGAGLCGFLVAFPCLRVESDFLSLITIAFASVFTTVALNWMSMTKGPMGLPQIPVPAFGSFQIDTPLRYYYLFLIVTVLVYWALHNIVHSRVGRSLQAVRDDPICASVAGIDVKYYKVLAFTVGTLIAGMAGSLMAHYITFISPTAFTFDISILMMDMIILGGLGSLPGSILGAIFFIVVPEIFRPLAVYRLALGGVVMILVMLTRPQGIMGSPAWAGGGGFQGMLLGRIRRRRSERDQAAGPRPAGPG